MFFMYFLILRLSISQQIIMLFVCQVTDLFIPKLQSKYNTIQIFLKVINYKFVQIIFDIIVQFFQSKSLKYRLSNKFIDSNHIKNIPLGIYSIYFHIVSLSYRTPQVFVQMLKLNQSKEKLTKTIFLYLFSFLINNLCHINYQKMINQNQQNQSKELIKPQNIIINAKQTIQCLNAQINIIEKCIKSLYWKKKTVFPKVILYTISVYTFLNPVKFITPMYKQLRTKTIKQDNSYILINQLKDNEYQKPFRVEESYSITIKVLKIWRKVNVNENDLNQIIMKSKHLMNFFKGIIINNPRQRITNQDQDDFSNLNKNWQKTMKSYTLVCQNYDYFYQKINQVQRNNKTHKIDQLIVKTYIEMMKRNIMILSIQSNNNTDCELMSQGKFVYFQNNLSLPLKSKRYEEKYRKIESFKDKKQRKLPYLKFINNLWHIEWTNQQFQIYQGLYKKRIDRGKGKILNFQSEKFFYDDFKIQSYQTTNYNEPN